MPRLSAQPNTLALQLSYAGLAPFVGGAVLVWLVNQPDALGFATQALSSYAAVILSFLGALHWGMAMNQPDAVDAGLSAREHLAWGVTPSLVAWVAAMMPAYAGLVVHGVMLVVCYLMDRRLYPQWGLQGWLTLRFRLTVVAALSCFLAAAGS